MVRKQVYIEGRQERLLKRRAKELGVTEAELIRKGIDLIGSGPTAVLTRAQAIKELFEFADQRAAMRVPQTGRGWTREELYEERLARISR